ncbi:MAG TPA: acetolactate synthase small subunit [Acidimicrobiales bacterium]|nr:acetolactate synthase small subunit [Acidimicrobiales bacterium]
MSAPAAAARHHLVTLRVENKAGVLARVASLFSRRGYNIYSLAVAPTDDERFSRIAVVVDVESAPLQQILDQIAKLVNVVEITELDPERAHVAELLLATVRRSPEGRRALEEAVAAAGATVVDESEDALTVLLAGAPEALDAFAAALAPHGIVEVQRTGRVGLPTLGGPGRGRPGG